MSKQSDYLPYPKGFATEAIHHAQEADQWDSMCMVPPIVTSTLYKMSEPGKYKKYLYSRLGNPTRDVLEKLLAKLEPAKYALTFASGSAALTALLGLVKCGDHIIYGNDIYGGTRKIFDNVATNHGIEVSYSDFVDVSNFEKSIRKNTKLVWIETPSNPMMQVIDIQAVSEIAKKNGIIFAVDNTFLTSYLQRPLNLGADIVGCSLSKYVNGHNDVTMGVLLTSNTEVYEKLKYQQTTTGNMSSPFDCYQVIRSLKTLPLRLQQHNKNGLLIAQFLENHPKIEKVLHPGLPSHPQHELFKKQTCGNSGVFSFYIKGNYDNTKTFMTALKLITLAGSLGGMDSVIELPTLLSHFSLSPERKAKVGITDTLIRISIGIEDIEDLIADLEQALKVA